MDAVPIVMMMSIIDIIIYDESICERSRLPCFEFILFFCLSEVVCDTFLSIVRLVGQHQSTSLVGRTTP